MSLATFSVNIPQNLKNNAIYALVKLIHIKLLEDKLNALYARYTQDIEKLRNMYKGKRLIIVGTGPSLNKTNLKLLQNEYVMGVNNFYRANIPCNFYVMSDVQGYHIHIDNMLNGPTGQIFLPNYAGIEHMLTAKDKNDKIYPIRIADRLSFNIHEGVYAGETVIVPCLQIAYFLGFQEVYLIGCDCDYGGPSGGEDYWDGTKADTKATNYLTGDWTTIFKDYDAIRCKYVANNRCVYNSTVGGKLEVFPRKTLKKAVSKKLKNG